MKHVVVSSELRETDIRPAKLISKFMELSIQDARRMLSDPAGLVEVSCPACGATDQARGFEKHGFCYVTCVPCGSLFVSPRPTAEKLADYFLHSEASDFRAEHLMQATAEARRLHVLRSQANWLGRLIDETGNPVARGYSDIGTNFPFLFDEIARLELFDTYYSIRPLRQLEEAVRQHRAIVTDDVLTGLGAVSAFEQLEHQFSPLDFIRSAAAMLAPGGMLFLTTRTISGFDLRMLWEKNALHLRAGAPQPALGRGDRAALRARRAGGGRVEYTRCAGPGTGSARRGGRPWH